MNKLIPANTISEEISKLKQIKEQLSQEAPELVTPEIVASIYNEINAYERSFFAANGV
ncbi:hypothetical protein AB6F95_004637 [Salmonella enterica]